MSGEPTCSTITSDITLRTITLDVNPGDYRMTSNGWSPRVFAPARVTVRVFPHETRVNVRGGAIKKDGTPGLRMAESEWSTYRHSTRPLTHAPGWVVDLVARVTDTTTTDTTEAQA